MAAADYAHSPTPEEIMEYLDGEGTAPSRAAIGAHLENCAACRSIASEQRNISEHARAWNVDPAPASLRAPAATSAPILPRAGAWRPSRVVLAGLAAAAAVLVVVSFIARETQLVPESRVAVDGAAAAPVAGRQAGGAGGSGLREAKVGQGQVDSLQPMANAATSMALSRSSAVIRTATLRIVAKEFGGVRSAVEAAVSQAGGFIDQMTVTGDNSTARELRGTLRVPGDRLADALARLRQLGQVVEDAQGSQDVADQIVDLDARLASARATERRLAELLRNRTGKLSDVLEVERELARVRLDIERLDAEKTNMGRRVTYATIAISVAEERKAGLAGPLSLATRIRIAAADGLESALEDLAGTLLFLLRAGPTLILLGMVAGIVWVSVRRIRQPSA